jgi:hypothetical protein
VKLARAYTARAMADDAIPPRVIDSRSGSIRLAPNVKAKPPPPKEQPEESTPEEDVPAARSGVITMASEVARDVRDAVVTASRPAVKNDDAGPPPRQPRTVLGTIVTALLCSGAGLGGMEARLQWSDPQAEAQAHSAGRIDELSRQVQTMQAEASRARAGDLLRDYDHAMSFRSLDGNIASLQDAFQVPVAARVKLDTEIQRRHSAAIEAYESAQRDAQRKALEDSVADRDTIGGP